MAVATAALVVSGCSPSGNPSTPERTTTTTATTTAAPVSGEQRLCTNLAAVDLSNPQELLKIRVPRTTDRAFNLPVDLLLAKLVALESALKAGANPAYPTQDAANAVTSVLETCRQRGYL